MNIERINFDLTNLKSPIIIIIGPPGSGKTVVGLQLAKTLNWNFYDTDVLIEQATSMKIVEIFAKHKEEGFRQLEKSLLNQMTSVVQKVANDARSSSGTIISCGGGLPIPPQNLASLTRLGQVICLQASISVLIERIGQVKHRPLLNPCLATKEYTKTNSSEQFCLLEKLLAQRNEIYAQASHQVDTSNKSIKSVVKTIRTLLSL